MSDTYSMSARCRNCGHDWEVEIPKGTPVVIYEKEIVCGNCGLGDVVITRKLSFR